MNLGLEDKVVLVTGGSSGIGLETARRFAAEGARVLICARRPEVLDAARDNIEGSTGQAVETTQADVTRVPDIDRLLDTVTERFGRLDILVNNAGVANRKRPELYTPEEWHRLMDTNLSGAFFAAQAAYPEMKRAGGGKIVNIGSMMSIFGAPFAAAYAASKGGIVQLTKALATAWASDNIQVNCILPGWIDTELTRTARTQVEGLHERVLARTPAGRWGVPDDLAGTAVFLASAASDFVTGTAIPVDGGYAVQG